MSRRMLRTAPALLLGLLLVAPTSAQERSASGVVDAAGMFSADALRQARADLAKLQRAHGVAVTIETVTTLKGDSIDEAAVRRAERLGHKGVFVLIAEKEHKAEVLAAPRALFEELGKARLNEIRDAFTEEFRRGKLDEGLAEGVKAAEKVLATRASQGSGRPVETGGGFLPSAPSTAPAGGSSAGDSPLVARQQVRLTLAGARKAIAGAEAKAAQQGWKMNIAVVDDGGHLLAFGRMDGARPASVATATTKAVSAATYRQATGPIGTTDPLLNLGVENAAAASGAKVTTLYGGVPILVDGQVIGAIGVGGGSGDQDAEAAKAGLAAFLEGLQAKPKEPEAKPKEPEADAKPKEAARPADADASPK